LTPTLRMNLNVNFHATDENWSESFDFLQAPDQDISMNLVCQLFLAAINFPGDLQQVQDIGTFANILLPPINIKADDK